MTWRTEQKNCATHYSIEAFWLSGGSLEDISWGAVIVWNHLDLCRKFDVLHLIQSVEHEEDRDGVVSVNGLLGVERLEFVDKFVSELLSRFLKRNFFLYEENCFFVTPKSFKYSCNFSHQGNQMFVLMSVLSRSINFIRGWVIDFWFL